MKKILQGILNKLGYVVIKKTVLDNSASSTGMKSLQLSNYDMANARGNTHAGLEDILKKQGKLKWLEVGTGGRQDQGFDYIDIIDFPPEKTPQNYRKINIITCSEEEIRALGKYDFIRMQHVFEHFTPEEGLTVLKNCSEILNEDGYLLISCPDIDIVINSYQHNNIQKLNGGWGIERFDQNAPDSFYFSIFTHSVLSEPHLWCYNAEGLSYQLGRSGKYKNIEILGLDNTKSAIPFTHNRPQQDVVILAQRK